MKEIKITNLIGKTIENIEDEATNCFTITFTDKTKVLIDTEYFGHNIYGPIAYLIDEYKSK